MQLSPATQFAGLPDPGRVRRTGHLSHHAGQLDPFGDNSDADPLIVTGLDIGSIPHLQVFNGESGA